MTAYLPVASFLSRLSAADWIDVACFAVLAFFITADALRGLSATLAQIAALVVSFKLSFYIYPYVVTLVCNSGTGGVIVLQIAAFVLTLVLLYIIYRLVKYILAKVVHVILVAPIDNVLGALAGALKGVLVIFVVFSAVLLVTGNGYGRTAFAKSRAGRALVAPLEKILVPASSKLPASFGRSR